MDRKDLPVEIMDNELPEENSNQHISFYDERVKTSGGFTDAIFLGAIMVVCFMWGMLVVILG